MYLFVVFVVLDLLYVILVHELERKGATWACDAQFLVYIFIQGNALKNVGRVEEAIICYQVQGY